MIVIIMSLGGWEGGLARLSQVILCKCWVGGEGGRYLVKSPEV